MVVALQFSASSLTRLRVTIDRRITIPSFIPDFVRNYIIIFFMTILSEVDPC
jgi:hypothetical protein